jgi:hypothetical protein
LFLTGTPAIALNGEMWCYKDFIVIPNPQQNQMPLRTDRFCGNALISTTSKYPAVYALNYENI